MGVRIISERSSRSDGADGAAIYDSVTGVAFGPVFTDHDEAERFLEHLREIGERDPRVIPVSELVDLANEWREEQT